MSTNLVDALGRNICSIDPLGNRTTTIWSADSQQAAIMNPLGSIWTNSRDADGRIVAVQNPVGSVNSTVWDSVSRRVADIDALGNTSTAIFNINNRQIAAMNPLGYLSSSILDLASRVIAQVDALNNRSTTVYDGRNLAIAQINPLGFATSTIFNANQAPIARMDPAGYLSSTILDAAGRAIASIDANNNYSSTTFDVANRVIARINALNQISSTSYNANSNPISTQDALGRISSSVFDPLDRVQATITPMGYITTVNRDADGRTISTLDAAGSLHSTVFNNASQQIASVSPLGYIQTMIRDAANRVIGNQNSLGYIYTNILDAAGRQIATVSPLAFRTSVVWDNASQRVASIDALGNYATSVWAANGRQIAEQNELGYLTSFILDAASQRICVVDANNGRSTTLFSNRGDVAAEQNQFGLLTSFTQDSNGNNILRVDARNWPTTYTLDPLNRVSGKLYIDSTRVTNIWDAASQQITSQDVTGGYTFVWDLDGRKTAVQNPTGINLTATLDALGNRLVLQDNYGTTSYAWDLQSRLNTIWNPYNERTTLTWDPLDREQYRVLANGMAISHTWDPNGRETAIGNYNSAGAALAQFTNTYSAVDTRLTVLELDGTRATFSYDASSQIISEARGGTMAYSRSYVWDPLGNRLQQYDSGALTAGTFNAANQQTLITPPSGPPTSQTFDNAGNLTLEQTGAALVTSTWSPENRLSSYADANGSSVSSLYSDDGLRRQRTKNGVTSNLTYDDTVLLLETDTSGTLDARYTNYPEVTGGIVSQNVSGVSSMFGFDTQGSARILVSIGGLVTDSKSWKAFGEPIQPGSGTITPYGYCAAAAYYIELAELFNAWNRWMEVTTGQWRSVDELGFGGGDWNLRRYVGNSPQSYADPLGRQAVSDGCYQREFERICATALPPYNGAYSACVSAKGICGKPFSPQPDCAKAACPGDPRPCGGPDSGLSPFCVSCAAGIHNTWSQKDGKLTWYHECNHMFVHCMACCWLAKRVGPKCAAFSQEVQDRVSKGKHKYIGGPGDSHICRLLACGTGLVAAQSSDTCLSSCLKAWPFDGGPNCSSTTGAKIDCKGRSLTSLPSPPGCS